jgi:ABC-type Fe3+ transport system substrate-binding protein
MLQFHGEQKGTALVREIAANLKPVLTDGRLAMARAVAAGEYLFALNNFVNLVLNVKLKGGPIDFFPLDPVPLFFAQVAVSAMAPNPNTARLAANFMLSRDCQVFYTKFGRLPTRGDIETNPPGITNRSRPGKWCDAVLPGRGEAAAQTFETLLRKR